MHVVLLPQLSPRIATAGPLIECQDLPFQISAFVGPPLAMQNDRVAQDSAAGALPGGLGSLRHFPPIHCSANAWCFPELPMKVPVARHQNALVHETRASASFLATCAADVAACADIKANADVAGPIAITAARTGAARTRRARNLTEVRPDMAITRSFCRRVAAVAGLAEPRPARSQLLLPEGRVPAPYGCRAAIRPERAAGRTLLQMLVDAGQQGVGSGMPGVTWCGREVDPHQARSRARSGLRKQASREGVALQGLIAVGSQRRGDGGYRHGELDDLQRHVGRRRQGGGQPGGRIGLLRLLSPATDRLEYGRIRSRVIIHERSGPGAYVFCLVGELSGTVGG